MEQNPPAPRAHVLVVATADSPLASALVGLVTDAGFEAAGVVGHWRDALEYTIERRTDVVVVELALAGRLGTRLVALMRAAADCEVYVVSALRAIHLDLVEAGAAGVVSDDDLRPLATMLRRHLEAPTLPSAYSETSVRGNRSSKTPPA